MIIIMIIKLVKNDDNNDYNCCLIYKLVKNKNNNK